MIEPHIVALTKKIAAGDAQAEAELFALYGEQIKLMVWARLRKKIRPAEREDLVSEAQTAVLHSLRRRGYDPATGKTLGAYIAGIASNVVGQYFRRQQRNLVETGVALEAHTDPANIAADVLAEERDRILRECLQRLPEKYKEALRLRVYDQLSVAEMSERLGLEPRRVSERIHYALQLLAKECRKENYFQY